MRHHEMHWKRGIIHPYVMIRGNLTRRLREEKRSAKSKWRLDLKISGPKLSEARYPTDCRAVSNKVFLGV